MTPLRWQIGEVSITRIAEICVPFPREGLCPNSDQATFDRHSAWLRPHFVDDDGNLLLSIHSLLIRSEGKNILVDTCLGEELDFGVFPDAGPAFMESLREAGMDRNDIDVVLCTHLHYDHIGWNTLLAGDRRIPTFPNARYLFAKTEWQHWIQAEDAGFPMTLDECVQPVIDAGLASFVEMDHRITRDVRLEPTPGHTPGHVSVKISSKGEEAFITGDAVVHPVQWAEIEWGNSEVDHDLNRAIAIRRELRDRYCETDSLIIGTHFASPTAGYIRKHENVWYFEAKLPALVLAESVPEPSSQPPKLEPV